MINELRKQSGLTLIEVLATLVILTMLTGLTFGVLTTSVKYNEKTQSHVSLRQEANIIVTTIRQLHQTQSSDSICFNNSYFDNNIEFKGITIKQDGVDINCKPEIIPNPTTPLEVSFLLADHQQNDFAVNTVIEAKYAINTQPITIELPQSGSEGFCVDLTNCDKEVDKKVPDGDVAYICTPNTEEPGYNCEGVYPTDEEVKILLSSPIDTDGFIYIPPSYGDIELDQQQEVNIIADAGIFIGANVYTKAANADITLTSCDGPIIINKAIFETGTGQTNITMKTGKYIEAKGSTFVTGRTISLVAADKLDVSNAKIDNGGGQYNIELSAKTVSDITDTNTTYNRTPIKTNNGANITCP